MICFYFLFYFEVPVLSSCPLPLWLNHVFHLCLVVFYLLFLHFIKMPVCPPVLVLCVSVCSCPVLFPSCVCFPPVSSFVSFEPINQFFVSPLFWSESTFGSSPCKVFVLLIKWGLVKSLLFLCLIIYLGYLFILKGKQVAVCGFQA